jgi:sulfotransferase family protein
MKNVTFTFQSGDGIETIEVCFPPTPRPDFPSCGVFAFAKSGSVLVNAIVRELMAEVGVPVIDWPEVWYARAIDTATVQCDLTQIFPPYGYCLGGFREIPRSFLGTSALRRLRKVMVVRDPRDMLVSRYFSTRFSHGFEARGAPQFSQLMRQLIEDGEMDLDRYCLFYSWIVNADFFLHRDIIADPLTLILKYEDFVYDKRHLVDTVCNWFSLVIPDERRFAIVARYAGIPVAEQPDQHIRQAHPGDYRRKLKPETIAALDGVLANFMATFGY